MSPANQPLADLEYSIATSWDDALLDELAAHNRAHGQPRFAEIYGAFRTSITGCGRPSYRLPHIGPEEFERHVRRVRALGMRFNYVMNAPDFCGQETDPDWLRAVAAFLGQLAGSGVSGVTIAHPALLRFVKREFPDLRLTVSLIAGVDTVASARRFEDLGADVINLSPFTVNRDFDTLHAIRHAVRCALELYANIPCLDRCPWRVAHYEFSGHASQAAGTQDVTQDPFLMLCSLRVLSDPVEFLRSPFIRPEDVGAYRAIGIDLIKLSDRTESTEFLVRTARAYGAERYEGDLFDLIFRDGRKIRAALGPVKPGRETWPVPVRIDNAALDSLRFIDRIKALRGAALAEFYRSAAAQAVSIDDPRAIDQWLRRIEQALPVAQGAATG